MLFLKRFAIFILSLCFIGSSTVVRLWAQSDRGTITGSVTDSSGAVVAGVSISATNTGTGLVSKATSGANGGYTIPLLPVGIYNVAAEQAGFKKAVRDGVTVQIGQTARLDFKLEVGEVTQSVEVQAEAPLLRPDTSDLGTVISGQQIQELPLVGQAEQRSPAFFMQLAPGVTGRGTAYGGGPSFDARYLSTTASGSQSASTQWHLDGILLANGGSLAADPRILGFPQDAVGEFKVTTTNAPAEYGHTGGGITSFTLKSGTNQIHGSLYEYFRNEALDARGFFAKTTPLNKQNEFGFTVGGPIHKDKTFFFGWYNGFRVHQASSNFIETVPTDALKSGDLSAYLGAQVGTDALGRPVYQGAVYDPATTRTVTVGVTDPATGLPGQINAVIRDPFPGNIIPANRFDSVAKNILPLFPAPTGPGIIHNYGSATVNANGINQWGTKIDHAITSNNKIFGSFLWSNKNSPGAASLYEGALSNSLPSIWNIRTFRFSDDAILRPNLINHVTFGFNRNLTGSTAPADRLGWPARIGLTGVNEAGVFPGMNIAGQGDTYGNTGVGYDGQNNFNVSEGLSWIKGRHTFKFGFEYLKQQDNLVSTGRDAGYFSFNTPETALPGFTVGLTGVGMGSFLLGHVDSGEVRVYTGGTYERDASYAAYAQDDFKVNPKLTINMGLRYDLYRPTVDKQNHLAWVDMTAPNPAIGGFPGTMIFATPERRTGVDQFNKGFGPRFGLAYSVNDKTVVRASYGLFWAAGSFVVLSQGQYNQGYNAINTRSSPDQGLTPAFVLQNGWPASAYPAPPFIDPTFGFNAGVHILDPSDGHPPYLQNYVMDIQRQLPGQILLDVAFVGNKGTRLQSRLMPTNNLDPKYFTYGNLLFTNIADPAVQALSVVQAFPVDPSTGMHVPFVGYQSIVGAGATLGQALRPTPQYGQEGTSQNRRFFEGTGTSNYDALQVKLDKRFSNGLSFLVSYTWSKTLTNAESQFSEFSGFTLDPYHRQAEKALSINDYPQSLVANYIYELPFGPGKKFANTGGAAGKVIGGWKIAGIQQYQSGGPAIVQTGNSLAPYAGPNGFFNRPNIVPGVDPRSAAVISGNFDPAKDGLFNTAAFTSPDPFTFGDAPRTLGNARRFAFLNEDISLIKRTQVNERVNVDFRVDFLNVFNRVVFGLGTGGDQYGTTLGGFGVSSQSNYPREIQFGLRINY